MLTLHADTSHFIILTKLTLSFFEVLMGVLPVAWVLFLGQLMPQRQVSSSVDASVLKLWGLDPKNQWEEAHRSLPQTVQMARVKLYVL